MANKKQPKNNNILRQLRINIFWIYGVIFAIIILWSFFGTSNDKPIKGNWAMVEQMIAAGEVERIVIENRETARVVLKKEAAEEYRKGRI